jgi:hypothetical protein
MGFSVAGTNRIDDDVPLDGGPFCCDLAAAEHSNSDAASAGTARRRRLIILKADLELAMGSATLISVSSSRMGARN